MCGWASRGFETDAVVGRGFRLKEYGVAYRASSHVCAGGGGAKQHIAANYGPGCSRRSCLAHDVETGDIHDREAFGDSRGAQVGAQLLGGHRIDIR